MTEAHVENLTDEIQRVVREQIETVREAVKELQRVLLDTSLTEAFQSVAAPLDAEAAHLITEIQTLSKSRDELTPRLAARRRLLAIEIDQCIAAGNDAEAAAKRSQAEEEEKRLRDLGEKINQYGDRCAAIGAQKSRLAKEIFESAYSLFPVATFSLLGATVDLLDGLKQGMFDYAESTGISGDFPNQLPKSYHIGNLCPTELPGSDRVLSRRIDNWFGPARR
jgi:seryl-tRNA synthetase